MEQEDDEGILTGDEQTKTWRHQLIDFIVEQQGSYVDKKWQLDFFEEFKMVGFAEATPNSKMKDSEAITDVMTRSTDLSLKSFERQKMMNNILKEEEKKIEKVSEETGQTALRLSSTFHQRVLLIKKHLEQKKHPIAKIMTFFMNVYSCQYYFLLMKNQKVCLKTYIPQEKRDD